MAVADHPCSIRRWCDRENFRRRALVRQRGISVYILMGIMPFVALERNESARAVRRSPQLYGLERQQDFIA